MKTKNFLIIILLGIIMIACSPSPSTRNHVINQYFGRTSLYLVSYKDNFTEYNDTLYCIAYDKYEVIKYIDTYFKDTESTPEYKITEVSLNNWSQYKRNETY